MESRRIRIRLDEHVPHAVAHALRRQEIDVETANDADQVGVIDVDILATCLEEGRVVVTYDRDFMRLHAQGAMHAGIVFVPRGRRTVGEMVDYLQLLADVYSPADMDGRVEYM